MFAERSRRMRREQVQLGQTYVAKINGHLQPVRVLRESIWGGWDCRDRVSGREIRVKTSAKLRRVFGEEPQS
jgi:hypothetical protein